STTPRAARCGRSSGVAKCQSPAGKPRASVPVASAPNPSLRRSRPRKAPATPPFGPGIGRTLPGSPEKPFAAAQASAVSLAADRAGAPDSTQWIGQLVRAFFGVSDTGMGLRLREPLQL